MCKDGLLSLRLCCCFTEATPHAWGGSQVLVWCLRLQQPLSRAPRPLCVPCTSAASHSSKIHCLYPKCVAKKQTQRQERRQTRVGISLVQLRGFLLHPAWITLSQPVLYLAFVCSFLSLLLLATGEDSSSLSHAQSPVMSLSQRPVPRILPSTTPTGAILLLSAQKPR